MANDSGKALGALDRAVLRQTTKAEQARRQHGTSIIEYLRLMGALGWLLVTPPLILCFLGRWLDHAVNTGFELTAGLLLIGIGLGAWLGWRRMKAEIARDKPPAEKEKQP